MVEVKSDSQTSGLAVQPDEVLELKIKTHLWIQILRPCYEPETLFRAKDIKNIYMYPCARGRRRISQKTVAE